LIRVLKPNPDPNPNTNLAFLTFSIMSTTSLLSPLAEPFLPHPIFYNQPALQFSIFNDGIPTLYPVDQHDIVTGISDEAIEDHFPPTMDELAELEEVDFFVQMLAHLDLLESREEQSRDFADLTKRWSTRRKEGAKNNKPHDQGQSSRYHQSHDHGWLGLNEQATDLVQFNKGKDYKRNGQDIAAQKRANNDHSKRNPKANIQHKRPIQQPRKQNC